MPSCCNMTFEPAVERGGPWGRDLFTFVTSAACHMMRTLQKPRKNRPSKRQVNHRRFLHNMIQRKFAEIEAANHQLASALFSSSTSNNQLDPPSPTQPTNSLTTELSKEGMSASSPRPGTDVSDHEEASELWVLDAHTDTTNEGTDLPGHPPPGHHSCQRLNAPHDTSTTGENMSPDQILKPCQALNHTQPQQSEPSSEDDHSESASASLESLSNMLAMNDLWLEGTRTVQRASSSSSLTLTSPNTSKELLMAGSDSAVFDFVSSLLDMSPPSLDTCDFGISVLTGQDQALLRHPTPPPDNPPMELSTSLDLFDSEEEGSDQKNGQDSQITMTTPWSVYFDGEPSFGIQDDGTHPSTQSNSCITKNQISIYGDQGGGPYLCAISNGGTHTANTPLLTSHLQVNSLVKNPIERADDLHGDRDMAVTRPSGPLHHVHQLSTHGPCRKGYEDELERACFPDENTPVPQCDSYNLFSGVPNEGYSYYQTSSSCSVTIKDRVETLSTDLSRLSAEAFWVDVTKGALKANPGSQASMQDELCQDCPRDDVSMYEDYVADSVEVLASLRPAVPDDAFQPQHVAINSIQIGDYSSCSEQVSGSGTSLHLCLSPSDCSHGLVCSVQSSCMKDDSAPLWASSSSLPECSTPFAGVAVSFPAPAQPPRPCQVVTPPLDHDLLFNDIVEEEMGVTQTQGFCGLH